MSSNIRIVKRKATGFFKPNELYIVRKAVEDVHHIITQASILIRAFYITCFDESKQITIDHQLISFACSIVQGKTKPPIRDSKNKDDENRTRLVETFNSMLSVYSTIYGTCSVDNVESDLSLSHVLAYSIENLLTAYENNININFIKYPKRFILCDLLNKGIESKEARKCAAIITSYYLYDGNIDPLENMIALEALPQYEDLFLPKQTKTMPRCYDVKVNPWLYLPKMVHVCKALEQQFPNVKEKYKKLLNPLPFHSTFIPMHARFDTSGISQLLMNKSKIDEFKTLYELTHTGEVLNMHTKGDMLSSFKSLLGREAHTQEEAGLFATDLWKFVTNLESCRQFKELYHTRKNDPNHIEWVFDNAIVTDGVSISFQVIKKTVFGRKTMESRKLKKQKKSDTNTQDTKESIDLSNYKVLGLDPGKKDILAVSDGSQTITYTKGKRQEDTLTKMKQRETLKRRRKNGIEDFETIQLNQYCKKSCCFETFKMYCLLRKSYQNEAFDVYGRPMFRQFKFSTYTKTKSSEDKFAHKIFETFKTPAAAVKPCMFPVMMENSQKEITKREEVLIGWGNWGKSPNALKAGSPTPGIGIRRRFERFFKTHTICEHMTSQTCPCCRKEKCLKKHTRQDKTEIHHLLRCTNDECKSSWWNRNVVGCFNILLKALEPETEPLPKRTKTTSS